MSDYIFLKNNNQLTPEATNKLISWLLNTKLYNFRYLKDDFDKMKRRATYLRSKIKKGALNLNSNCELMSKLRFIGHQWVLDMSPSFNEEYLELLSHFSIREGEDESIRP